MKSVRIEGRQTPIADHDHEDGDLAKLAAHRPRADKAWDFAAIEANALQTGIDTMRETAHRLPPLSLLRLTGS